MILRIIDCALVNKRGHHYEYVKAVYDEWVARGWPCRVYCHERAEADIIRDFDAKPIFSRSFHDRSRSVPGLGRGNLLVNLLAGNCAFWRDLGKIGVTAAGTREIFLVHTIDPNQLFGLCLWYLLLRPDRRPCLALIFRMGAGDNPQTRRYTTFLYRLFFRAASAIKAGRFVFLSDSASLAAEYEYLAKARVSVLPIPHVRGESVAGAVPPDDKFVIVYPGDARAEKGYHLLPSVIESVLSRRDDVRFVIQSNVLGNPPEEILEARRRIEARKDAVVYIDRILDSGEYFEILSRASAVLLPYSPQTYRGRTSGIFAEAIALGKPVVVSGGTWMQRQMEELGYCGIAMSEYTERELERAIEVLIDNSAEFRERAGIAAGRWRRFHNARTYVDMLTESVQDESEGGSRA